MKKLLAVTLLAMGSLTACGPAEESPSAEVTADSPFEGTVTQQALTWRYLTTESCTDMWTRTCSSTFPTSQCGSAVTHGSSCTVAGSTCWKVIDSNTVEQYWCR